MFHDFCHGRQFLWLLVCFPAHQIPSEKESALKGDNSLPGVPKGTQPKVQLEMYLDKLLFPVDMSKMPQQGRKCNKVWIEFQNQHQEDRRFAPTCTLKALHYIYTTKPASCWLIHISGKHSVKRYAYWRWRKQQDCWCHNIWQAR